MSWSEPGRCYDTAAREIISGRVSEGSILVHGRIGGSLGHAWIELAGRIWDPESKQWFPKDEYLSGTRAVEDRRYTREGMAQQIADSGHSGPWHAGLGLVAE